MLNHIIAPDMALLKHFYKTLSISVYLQDEKHLYRVDSVLNKQSDRIIFTDEKIYQKPINPKTTRNKLLHFDDSMPIDERSKTNNPYLKDVDSIFSGVLNKASIPDDSLPPVYDQRQPNRAFPK
ncbi:hypothetical protein EFK39_07785 [Lactococcus lactis subsp. lactis]|nr:hypothetical protein [Lactococcus lactis subsp. lactis]